VKNFFLRLGSLPLCLAVILLLNVIFSSAEAALLYRDDLSVAASERAAVIIDAGHGGIDGGATGANGVLEKDLNLEIAQRLADMLRLAGVEVIETRTDDRLLCDMSKPHKKRQDLSARLAYTNAHPESVLVSIHMNTFPDAACRGLQVWYSENHPKSIELARAVQAAAATLQPENTRRVKAATSSIYLLKHASTPALLIECGFISNPEEAELLCTDSYRHKVALTIYSSIIDYLNKEV